MSPAEAVVVRGPRPAFVSRGGQKLDAAISYFDISVAGRRALDAGASTGGFTDCLLQRGASHVWAVDVGRGQLHEQLRADPRVTSLERTNIRTLGLDDLDEAPFEVVVADLSFISLRTVAPALLGLAAPDAHLVVLVKPQFEAGRRHASVGRGVIRDPAVWAETLVGVGYALEAEGAAMMGAMVSPLRGADGNVEFLAYFRAHQDTDPRRLADRLPVAALIAEAAATPAMPAGSPAQPGPAAATPATAPGPQATPAGPPATGTPGTPGTPGPPATAG